MKTIFTLENINRLVQPLADKYRVKEIYLFGSYARGEADEDSDLDFLVYGGEGFKLTNILALGEELREVLKKKVDVFEIHEVNEDSDLYKTIMKEKVLVADNFDYTEWRKNLFDNMPDGEYLKEAAEYEKSHPFTGTAERI